MTESEKKIHAAGIADYFAMREHVRHAGRTLTPFFASLQNGRVDVDLLRVVSRELSSALDLIACFSARQNQSGSKRSKTGQNGS